MNQAIKTKSINGIKDVQGIVAVTDAAPTAGAIVWWRLSGTANYQDLCDAWEGAQLPPSMLLQPCTPATALRRAAHELKEKRRLVRPLGRGNGFAVVRERVTDDDQELGYEVVCKITLDAVGRAHVEATGDDSPDVQRIAEEVRHAYERHLTQLQGVDFSTWLVRLMPKLDAVGLRDSGGVYFVPSGAVEMLGKVAQVVRSVSAHCVHRVPAMRNDDAVDAILDAVAQEATSEADSMESELAAGEIGSRAFANRVARCEQVEGKLTRYEELLGRALPALAQRLEDLRAKLTVASLKSDDSNTASFAGLADL